MKVTIVGGGNIGTQFAEKEYKVYIRTSKPDRFSQILSVVNHNG